MKEWVVPTAGSLLTLIGLALVASHVRSRKRSQNEEPLDVKEREHLAKRYRRRLQASGMLAGLGVLIGIGDQLPILRRRPDLFGLYWIGVLLLTLWVMLLAVGDYFATQAHGRAAMARLKKKQQELEQELADHKRRGANGRDRKP